ncbi:MAG: hypothetical protein U0350_30680 [Caldilineaceae bacterium]
MAIAVVEMASVDALFTQAQSLTFEDQLRLILALSKRLPASMQVRFVMELLPGIAPTVEAVLKHKTAPIVHGGNPEAAHALLNEWLAESVSDEDGEAWEEIMRNLGAYGASA